MNFRNKEARRRVCVFHHHSKEYCLFFNRKKVFTTQIISQKLGNNMGCECVVFQPTGYCESFHTSPGKIDPVGSDLSRTSSPMNRVLGIGLAFASTCNPALQNGAAGNKTLQQAIRSSFWIIKVRLFSRGVRCTPPDGAWIYMMSSA